MNAFQFGLEISLLVTTEQGQSWQYGLPATSGILTSARMYDIPIQRVLVMKEDADADAEMKKAEVDLGWMVNSPLPI